MPGTLTITKSYDFDAAHRLDRLPASHKCHHLHGHTYKVDIEVEGPLDPDLGWVCDYAEIDKAWAPIHEALDHKYLNDIVDVPTTEILVEWIARNLAAYLHFDAHLHESKDVLRLVSVTLHESSSTKARYVL